MMNTPILPTLALSAGEIVSILIAIGVILSGILGQANETKKTQKRRQSAKRGDMAEGGSVTQLDEIAQRRRQQLEALARQRRGGGGQTQQDVPALGQRSDRETHRTASDELAAAVRAKETRDSVRWSDPGDRTTETNAIEARSLRQATSQQRELQRDSQRDIRRREAEQKAERKLQQQRERQLQQQQRQRQRPASRQQQVARPPVLVLDEQVNRRVVQSDEDRQTETDAQHALDQVYAVEAIDQPTGPTAARPVTSKMASLLGGRGWREALVLKEVLDRPVSMRNE